MRTLASCIDGENLGHRCLPGDRRREADLFAICWSKEPPSSRPIRPARAAAPSKRSSPATSSAGCKLFPPPIGRSTQPRPAEARAIIIDGAKLRIAIDDDPAFDYRDSAQGRSHGRRSPKRHPIATTGCMETAADLAQVDPMAPVPFMVLQRARRLDTFTISLRHSGAIPLPSGSSTCSIFPGWARSPSPSCTLAAHPGAVAHTIRSVGPVSSGLCRLEPKAPLGLRGPFGRRWPLKEAEGDLLCPRRGHGLAPLPAVESVLGGASATERSSCSMGRASRPNCSIASRSGLALPAGHRGRRHCGPLRNGAGRGRVGVVTTLLPGGPRPGRTTAPSSAGPRS